MASAEGVRLELTERQKELLEIRVVCLSAAINVMVRSVSVLNLYICLFVILNQFITVTFMEHTINPFQGLLFP